MGLPMNPKLVAQLDGVTPSPELGYVAAKKILASHEPFTALCAFNDISDRNGAANEPEAGGATGWCDAVTRIGLRRREKDPGLARAIHGTVCLQRYFRSEWGCQ